MVYLNLTTKQEIKEGFEEVKSFIPSKENTLQALSLISFCLPMVACSHAATAIGTVNIISHKDINIIVRLFFVLSFIGASTLSPFIGLPITQVVFALISAYAQYKKNPEITKMIFGAGSLLGVVSLASRFLGLGKSIGLTQAVAGTSIPGKYLDFLGLSKNRNNKAQATPDAENGGPAMKEATDEKIVDPEEALLDEVIEQMESASATASDLSTKVELDGNKIVEQLIAPTSSKWVDEFSDFKSNIGTKEVYEAVKNDLNRAWEANRPQRSSTREVVEFFGCAAVALTAMGATLKLAEYDISEAQQNGYEVADSGFPEISGSEVL